jgi:ribosomal protein S10
VGRRADRYSVRHGRRNADEVSRDVSLCRRERSWTVRRTVDRAHRRRQQLHRRSAGSVSARG